VSFPNLQLKPGGVLHSVATGVPVDGDNTFELGFDLENINDEWLRIDVFALGSQVTGATYVSRSGTQVTMNFTQLGTDQARVEAKIIHSSVR